MTRFNSHRGRQAAYKRWHRENPFQNHSAKRTPPLFEKNMVIMGWEVIGVMPALTSKGWAVTLSQQGTEKVHNMSEESVIPAIVSEVFKCPKRRYRLYWVRSNFIIENPIEFQAINDTFAIEQAKALIDHQHRFWCLYSHKPGIESMVVCYVDGQVAPEIEDFYRAMDGYIK